MKRLCGDRSDYALSLTTQKGMDGKGEPPRSCQPRHWASMGPSEDLKMNFPASSLKKQRHSKEEGQMCYQAGLHSK